jgi:hypothetical protein
MALSTKFHIQYLLNKYFLSMYVSKLISVYGFDSSQLYMFLYVGIYVYIDICTNIFLEKMTCLNTFHFIVDIKIFS